MKIANKWLFTNDTIIYVIFYENVFGIDYVNVEVSHLSLTLGIELDE